MTNEPVRITDKVGVLGIDATDYGDRETHQTTINTELLADAADIIATLGWDQVDVITVESSESADNPMLVLRPPHESVCGGEQAGIAITPRTEKGRNK